MQAAAIKHKLQVCQGPAKSTSEYTTRLGSWMRSIRLALLMVTLSCTAGMALRHSVCEGISSTAVHASNSQMQRSGANSFEAAAAPACALATVVLYAIGFLLPTDANMQTIKGASCTSDQSSQPSGHLAMRLKVVLLSFATLCLAAMASYNWALAYVVAAVLALVPMCSAGTQSTAAGRLADDSTADTRQDHVARSHSRTGAIASRIVRLIALAGTSPAVVLLAIGHTCTPGMISQGTLDCMVCSSRVVTYTMFWLVYLPLWLAAAVL